VNQGHAADQPARLGALLAVLDREERVIYMSPELERLLDESAISGQSPDRRSAFWSVLRAQEVGTGRNEPGQVERGRSRADPEALGLDSAALVQLHTRGGQTRTARMTRVPLPGGQLTLIGFLLETGERAASQLDSDQLRQLFYQFPVAAVGVGLEGQLLYANAQAIRNAEITEGTSQSFLGLNDDEYSELRGQDRDLAARRTRNLQVAIHSRQQVSWIDQVKLLGRPLEYWSRSYHPVYNELGELSLIAGSGIEVTADLHRVAELELLGHAVQNSSEAVLVVDLAREVEDSRIIFANRVATRLLSDGERRPLTGRSLYDVSLGLIDDRQRAQLRRLLRSGRGTSGPVYYAAGTHAARCLELSVVPGGTATTEGSYSHLCITLRDVTDADRTSKLERGRSRALQLALSGAPLQEVLDELMSTLESQIPGQAASVMLLRGDHLFFASVGGLPPELTPLIDNRQVGPNQGPCALAVHLGEPIILADIQADPRFQSDWDLARTFGLRSVWSLPFRGKHGQILGTFAVYGQRPRTPRPRQMEVLRQLADLAALLTENRQSSDQLERVVYHDALTGLPNRQAFMQALENRLDEVPPLRIAVGLIDLTGFRAINEAYGQNAGNRLLQQVAGRLQERVNGCLLDQESIGSEEPMLARLGGDEFALLLPRLNHSDDLRPISEKLQQALTTPFQVEAHEVTLQASIGWSLYPDLAADTATLLNQANTAMYTARQEGQPHRLYSQQAGGWSLSPTILRSALETALDQSQLHLVYQPLIGRTGRVRSFEALLRWTHPEYGQIAPDQFIPVAEMSGMIRHIGLWVLEQATRTALDWPPEVLVSVNISGRQFEHPGFAAEVAGILAQTGLDARTLELELTESALMTGDGHATRTLKELDELGVRVALDDYGVGYSNLMRLHTLPISTVKLDRSFTRDLPGHQPDAQGSGDWTSDDPGSGVNASAAIIRSVVGLAHDLGLEVVAEGIETPEQLRAVLELECDAVQGYFYSRPISAPAVLDWLKQRARHEVPR